MNWASQFWQTLTSKSAVASILEPVQPRVLLIIHNPTVPWEHGRKLTDVLGWHDPIDLVGQFLYDIEAASFGYGRYQIAETIITDQFPQKADGFHYDAESYLFRWRTKTGFHHPDLVDYPKLIQQFNIINRINTQDIDEVWLVAFPYAGYYESLMVGPDAFWCNAPPLLIPEANRRFVIMGFNYERGPGEMLESFGHRAESILNHLYRRKRGDANLWLRFTRHEKSHPGQAECGTIHYAPNSETDYDWGNPRPVLSRAHTWLNFPDLTGEPKEVTCAEWGGGDIRQHHLWWLGHLPHAAGKSGGISHNWWQYILNPNLIPQ
ncbi:MAG: hypothetical protein Kow0080_01720 [Candidatus Promineifilaceae bacterium]